MTDSSPLNKPTERVPFDHSVIIYFWYGKETIDELHELSFQLIDIVEKADVGVMDGHELNIDNTDGSLYLYGPNAEVLFKTIWPTLQKVDFMKNALVCLQFGSGEDAPTIELKLE